MSTLKTLFTEYGEYEQFLKAEREHKFQTLLQLNTLLDYIYENFDKYEESVNGRFTKERLETMLRMSKHGCDVIHRGFFVIRPEIEKTSMDEIYISIEDSYTLELERIIIPRTLIDALNLEEVELEIK